MEQSKVCATTSRSFSDELSAVYQDIHTFRNEDNSDHKQAKKGKYRKFAGIAMVGFFIFVGSIYAALRFLPPETWGGSTETIRLVLQLLVLLIYLLAAGVILLQYFSVKELTKDFTGQIIGFAADAAKDEAALFEAFDKRSTESIKYVADRLDHASTQLGQLRSFLLGAIEKIGIIPGLIATVIAISNLSNSTGVSWLELLSLVMLGIYMTMFPVTEASIKISRLSVLMTQYLVLFRENHGSIETENELQQNSEN
jgi:hypothetical protein